MAEAKARVACVRCGRILVYDLLTGLQEYKVICGCGTRLYITCALFDFDRFRADDQNGKE